MYIFLIAYNISYPTHLFYNSTHTKSLVVSLYQSNNALWGSGPLCPRSLARLRKPVVSGGRGLASFCKGHTTGLFHTASLVYKCIIKTLNRQHRKIIWISHCCRFIVGFHFWPAKYVRFLRNVFCKKQLRLYSLKWTGSN